MSNQFKDLAVMANYVEGINKVNPDLNINIGVWTDYEQGLRLAISLNNTEIINEFAVGMDTILPILKDFLGGNTDRYYYKEIPKACMDLLNMENLYIYRDGEPKNIKVLSITTEGFDIMFNTAIGERGWAESYEIYYKVV